MASMNDKKNKLYDRFKQYSGLPHDHLELFFDCIVATECSNLSTDSDTSDEEELDTGVTYYKPDGSEFTLADVPLRSLVKAIEGHIQIFIAEHRRTEVYDRVVEGYHGIKKVPRWDCQEDNPRAKPQTTFSESRAPLKSRITNESLFKIFVSASNLDPGILARIRGMIVWRDSARSNGTWGAIEWDTFKVTGGRLGPTEEHTLSDVPHCYVRDCLIAYTIADADPERRDQVWQAVFSDLTSSQIQQYAAAIEEIERKEERHMPAKIDKPRRSREVSPAVPDRALLVERIQRSRKIGPAEAECIMREDELLDAIDDTIGLTPNPSFTALKLKATADSACSTSGLRSVLRPDTRVQEDDEVSVPEDCAIDRDCDQVRAMIRILVRKGHWTVDQFVRALDSVRHRQLIEFLKKRGPLQGKKSSVFRRSWEFFKKRELLGFELTAAVPKNHLKPPPEVRVLTSLREVNPNRGHKRHRQESLEGPEKLRKLRKL
ncbi:hypothetical protein F4678DRAFT_462864 [Xylaria arbuscula]|nr:hypothetical protein F4678DRAFT_462864 [Xylaria arbuscula]